MLVTLTSSCCPLLLLLHCSFWVMLTAKKWRDLIAEDNPSVQCPGVWRLRHLRQCGTCGQCGSAAVRPRTEARTDSAPRPAPADMEGGWQHCLVTLHTRILILGVLVSWYRGHVQHDPCEGRLPVCSGARKAVVLSMVKRRSEGSCARGRYTSTHL